MPTRAIWKGAISFGMVVIPVRLYIATESKDISLVTLHSTCSTRLRQKRYCKVSVRQKEHICCLRPYDHAIVMETMYYPDELRGMGS